MENLINDHVEQFGVEPVIIGLFWNDPIKLMDEIEIAMDRNHPYNEIEMLSDEQRKAYEKGDLSF